MFITTEQVWNVFHTSLLQFIRTRVADDSSAEDILQEVFLKLHRELKDVKKLESWVYQITRHTMIDFYRNKEQPKASLDAKEVLGLAEDLPDDDVITDLFPAECERWSKVSQSKTARPGAHRISGAKSRVQRAREKLKQILLECCHVEEEFYS